MLLALTPFAKYIHYVNCMQGGDLSVRRVITLPPSCSNIKQGSDITLGLYASAMHLYIFAHVRTLNRTRMQIYISFSNSQSLQLERRRLLCWSVFAIDKSPSTTLQL